MNCEIIKVMNSQLNCDITKSVKLPANFAKLEKSAKYYELLLSSHHF